VLDGTIAEGHSAVCHTVTLISIWNRLPNRVIDVDFFTFM